MSAVGRTTAFAAEAALWIAGAAVIAGMAGAHWSVEIPVDSLLGSTPSPAASPSASPSATLALETLAPGASPTASPLVAKYQAYVAGPDYQIVAKYINVSSGVISGKPVDISISGTMGYKDGNHTDYSRITMDGAVATDDTIALGAWKYESVNSAAWTKKARPASDIASDRLIFAPVALFFDRGVETKNGLQLHRLDIADPVAYSKALLKTSTSGATEAQYTYSVWVNDDGVPAAIRLQGWSLAPIKGESTKETDDNQFRIIATSGVTISAPI
jgi:hypothetical protein